MYLGDITLPEYTELDEKGLVTKLGRKDKTMDKDKELPLKHNSQVDSYEEG